MKILFVPLSDSSIAHTIRCLSVAQIAHQRKHEILFAADKKVKDLILSFGFKIYQQGFSIKNNKNQKEYYYNLRKYEINAAKAFKADIIINDPLFAGYFIYKAIKTPFINICNSTLLPCYAGNYGYGPSKRPSRKLNFFGYYYPKKVIFNNLKITANKLGVEQPKKYDDLFLESSKIFIPSFNFLDPVIQSDPIAKKCQYSGSLTIEATNKITKNLKEFIKKNKKIIYISFGGSVFDKNYYNVSISATLEKEYSAIVSLGPNIQLNEIDKKLTKNKNVYIAKYVPGLYISKIAKIIIHSGGHGTFLHCLQAKKPSITMPYNIDQSTFSETGKKLGISLSFSKNLNKTKKIENFKIKINSSSVKDLKNKISYIEKHSLKFKKKLEKFSKRINSGKTKKSALSIIKFCEQLINSRKI